MDSLPRGQDAIIERIERSGVQGPVGPKLNKPENDGNLAPQRKLANEKPQGGRSITTR